MKKGIAILLLLVGSTPMYAQTTNTYQDAYDEFRKKAQGDYEEFRRQCNEKYATFMERAWQLYQGRVPIPIPKEEHPITPVRFDDSKADERNRALLVSKVIPPVLPVIEQPSPICPIKEQSQPSEKRFSFVFYGTPMTVRLDDTHKFKMKDGTEKSVAEAWRFCSSKCYDNVIRDCLALRIQHHLGDWAYLRMLQELGNNFMGKSTNEASLLTAYLYCQSGYKMRLAKSQSGKIYLLIATNHMIYERRYFVIDDETFYPLNCDETGLSICNVSFPKEQPLSLWMTHDIGLSKNETQPRLLKSERYPEIQLSITSNKNIIDFFNDYPSSQIGDDYMTKWAIYANTPLLQETADELYPSLKKAIIDQKQEEAANKLLNFVQTAFEYEYDETVWGADRTFFAEETIYYPYCDCEDRSVLFSRLIRDLMDLDVVLVYYPGHLATAVGFTDEVKGDYLMVNGRKFVVCDPTFINAPIGRTMPGMDNQQATVILLKR